MKKTILWAVMCLMLIASAAQAEPVTVKSAWLTEFEALPAWYAHVRQWDTAAGITLDMQLYPSGKYLMDNISSLKWDVAGLGGAPGVLGMLRKQACVVGIGSDESAANAVFVRKDSPLPAALRDNPSARDYARLVTGKIVLCPRGTSAHQLLLLWLDRMGLSEESVSLLDTPPDEAVTGLAGGMGDMAVLWAPQTYAAEQAGLIPLLFAALSEGGFWAAWGETSPEWEKIREALSDHPGLICETLEAGVILCMKKRPTRTISTQ